jgi:hypothetical protein
MRNHLEARGDGRVLLKLTLEMNVYCKYMKCIRSIETHSHVDNYTR